MALGLGFVCGATVFLGVRSGHVRLLGLESEFRVRGLAAGPEPESLSHPSTYSYSGFRIKP